LIEQAAIYKRNPDFIFRRIVKEILLVPIHQNTADMECIYTMNDVGAFIWEQLNVPVSFDELEAAMLAEFEADPQVLHEDLSSFLNQMIELGALTGANN